MQGKPKLGVFIDIFLLIYQFGLAMQTTFQREIEKVEVVLSQNTNAAYRQLLFAKNYL